MILKILLIFTVIQTAYFAQTDSIFIELNNGKIHSYSINEIRDIAVSGIPAGIEEEQLYQAVVKSFKLYQNYPNPFNPSTNIEYEIPARGTVEINIFDIQGRRIRSFGSQQQQAGIYKITWDGHNDSGISVASGTYFCRVHFNDSFLVNKLLLIK